MAETVYLSDGSREVVLTEKDVFLECLIREKLGYDAAKLFTDYVSELKDEIRFLQESVNELEGTVDDGLAMCHEAVDSFDDLLNLMDSARLDREALKKAAQAGHDALYKNL